MSAEPAAVLATGEYAEDTPKFWRLLWLSLRAHAVFFTLTLAYICAETAMSLIYGKASDADFTSFLVLFLTIALPLFVLAIVVIRFVRMALFERPDRPIATFGRDLKAILLSPHRLANGLPVVFFLFIFMCAFGAFKGAIPYYNPFSWDETFFELDRAVHFGIDPWVLLQPLLGFPVVTFVINVLYNLWFFTMWIIWMWLAFSTSHTRLRMQFFLTFVLCWSIGGTVLATMLSSAGPCYYGFVVAGADPFAPLMSYLHATADAYPIFAVETQQILWDGYLGKQDFLVGISAMPSMHNATAVLFALVGWRTSRTLGIVLTAYAAAILIGSVHLGWHYAIDGYFGAALVITLWWAAGRFVDWYEGTEPVRNYVQAMNRT